MDKLDLEKLEEPEINCQHLLDHGKIKGIKKEKKYIYFCFIGYTKAFLWITADCGKFSERWKYPITLQVS